jgi:ankyrin repeat protein
MDTALTTNDIDKITELLQEGFDPCEKDLSGNPLIFKTENADIIEIFLNYGLDPKITDSYGFTLEDYTDNDTIKEKLAEPRNAILINPPKFIKYRATNKSNIRRAKTRKSQVPKSV